MAIKTNIEILTAKAFKFFLFRKTAQNCVFKNSVLGRLYIVNFFSSECINNSNFIFYGQYTEKIHANIN
jgi:hypothetical protein